MKNEQLAMKCFWLIAIYYFMLAGMYYWIFKGQIDYAALHLAIAAINYAAYAVSKQT
jgi:hypothetical protein